MVFPVKATQTEEVASKYQPVKMYKDSKSLNAIYFDSLSDGLAYIAAGNVIDGHINIVRDYALEADLTMPDHVYIAQPITLDLNGHTLTTDVTNGAIYVSVAGVTIEDTSIEKTGAVVNTNTAGHALQTSSSSCKLSITGGTFSGGKAAFYSKQDGFSLTGGTFSSVPKAAYLAAGYCAFKTEDGQYVVDLPRTTSGSESITRGYTRQLTFVYGNENVSWSSSNEDVATVDDNGLVTAVAAGTAEITATVKSGANVIIASKSTPSTTVNVTVTNPYVPSTTPNTDITPEAPVTNTVVSGTEEGKEEVVTSTVISATASEDGAVEQTVDKEVADKIVANAVENNATEVVIEVTTTTGDATSTSVSLPAETIKSIVENTNADVTIKTDAAEITLDQKTAETIAKEATGENIQLVVEKTKDEEGEMHFDLKITSGDKTIGNFQGGSVTVKVALNDTLAAKDNLTSVYISDSGKYTKMGGQKNEDGTFSFNTGHFSTYAIMEEADADAVIADQNAAIVKGVKATTVKAKSKAVKGAITVSWTKSKGYKMDYYEIYRSTKKTDGYKKIYTTKKTTYKNTKSLKAGTRYYYKVRGVRTVDGKKVKTSFSNIVSRVAQ
jgi:hypothetical protein